MRTFLAILIGFLLVSAPSAADSAKPPVPQHKPIPISPLQATTTSDPPTPSAGKVEEPPHQQTEKEAGKTDSGPKGTEENPLIVKVIAPTESDPKTPEASDEHDDKSSADWWLVKLTGGLIFVGMLQAWVFWVQAGRLKETIKKMDEIATGQTSDMAASIMQATRAAGAMKDVADAAASSADVAKRTLLEIQRALVIPASFSMDTLVNDNGITGYRIIPIFENTGTTVAKNYIGVVNFVLWDGDIPDDFRYQDRMEIPESLGYIGPHVKAPFPIAISIKDIVDISKNSKRGFIYGWVEYNDIFEQTNKRRTEFCIEIKIVGNPEILPPATGGSSIFDIAVYGKYNGIDDDCYYKPGQRPPIGDLPPPA